MNPSPLAYVSFDVVPAPKGAAVHIEAFVRALADRVAPVNLISVAPGVERPPETLPWPGVTQAQLPALGETLIHRTLYFRARLREWLAGKFFRALHFRSIFEGLPLALERSRYGDRLIFEVNGLPSLELKYRYPAVAEDRELQHKIRAQEQFCLEAADLIITPSAVTAGYLQARGLPPEKIRVIPNGVDLASFAWRPLREADGVFRLFYFGTLSAWQGVDLAVRAVALCRENFPVTLALAGPGDKRQLAALRDLVTKLGLSRDVHYLGPLPRSELVAAMHGADVVLAPLSINDRNLVQGCCPLKVLEGMAGGRPVISSDLPVSRELGRPDRELLLVRPGSVLAIAEAVARLRENPELAAGLAARARQRVERDYSWQRAGEQLAAAYAELGIHPNCRD